MPTITLLCIARGDDTHWEAINLDFNLAVQGKSFDEVDRYLREAIETYVEDAMKEDEPTRSQLLSRRAPLSVQLLWIARIIWAMLCGRIIRDRDGKLDGKPAATVPFAVPCHA